MVSHTSSNASNPQRTQLKLRWRLSRLTVLSDTDPVVLSGVAPFVNQSAVMSGLTSEVTTKGFFWSCFSALRWLSESISILRFLWMSKRYWHCIGSSVCSASEFMLYFCVAVELPLREARASTNSWEHGILATWSLAMPLQIRFLSRRILCVYLLLP